MNKKGFTLIELLATIVIIGITITIVVVKIEGNLKKASDLSYSNQLALVEDSAIIYANEYSSELVNFNTLKVTSIPINRLISKGLFEESQISDLSSSNYVVVASINGELKAKYSYSSKNVIFLNGSENISINNGDTYPELGGYVAIIGTALVELTTDNIASTVNTNISGTYNVTYSYTGADDVIRKVTVN